MNQKSNVTWAMTEQNRQISAIFAEQRSRLRNFIRRRVPDPRDAEDILQDAFCKLVEANRLLMPIDHVTSWLFRVARNRITDLFRKKKPETFSHASIADEDGELLQIEDLLPSPDAGPEARSMSATRFWTSWSLRSTRESSTGRRKSFNDFMPQDSRRRAGITTFLNC
jgi:RNA polymerase sigma factor (sigma-70 family)